MAQLSQEQITIVRRPFPAQAIIRRKHDGLRFVDASHYFARLNEMTGHDWTAEMLTCEVLVSPSLGKGGKDLVEVSVYVRLTAGGLTRYAYGAQEVHVGMPFGEARKAALTDATKKAASAMGLGLEQLYSEAPPERAPEDTPSPKRSRREAPAEPPSPASRLPAHVEELLAAAERINWSKVQLAQWVRDQFGIAFVSLSPAQAQDALARLADLVARGPAPTEPAANPMAAQSAPRPGDGSGSISQAWPDHVKPLIALAKAANWKQGQLSHWTHREFGVAPAGLTPEQAAEAQGRFAEQLREPPAPKDPEPQTNLLRGLPPKFLNLMEKIQKEQKLSFGRQAEILLREEKLTLQQLAEKSPKTWASFEGLCSKVRAHERDAFVTSPDGPGNSRGT